MRGAVIPRISSHPPIPISVSIPPHIMSGRTRRVEAAAPRLGNLACAALATTLAALMSDDPKRRPTIALQPGRHKRAASGHPWVYSNEVAMDGAAKALPAGSLVTLRAAGGEPLGVA